MEPIVLPPPDEIRQRISDCEQELKALRRLLRASVAAHDAAAARQRRTRGLTAVARAEG